MSRIIELTMTISDAQTAIEYWLNNVVLRESTELEGVTFNTRDSTFEIKMKKPITP